MITFVDTGGWFSVIVPDDTHHAAATQWLAANTTSLLTTNYVVDETLTLLRSCGYPSEALKMGQLFFAGTFVHIYRLTDADELAAWELFRNYSDKEWSFTDCTSKVVMERLGIVTAFAFDQHFRQFGTVVVVP